MKKAIGIPLLLLANIVILAHAIVPHHHHNGIVVSICDLLSINEALEHHHDCGHFHAFHYSHDTDNHDHDGEFNEDCLLSNLYPRLSQDRQQHLSSDNTDLVKDIGYSLLFAVVPVGEIEIRDYGNLPFRQKPYILSSYSHYITHSLGLRAPPPVHFYRFLFALDCANRANSLFA